MPCLKLNNQVHFFNPFFVLFLFLFFCFHYYKYVNYDHPGKPSSESSDSKMTSTQVGKKSVSVTSNSPSQDYTHLDDCNLRTYDMTPGFKPFTALIN